MSMVWLENYTPSLRINLCPEGGSMLGPLSWDPKQIWIVVSLSTLKMYLNLEQRSCWTRVHTYQGHFREKKVIKTIHLVLKWLLDATNKNRNKFISYINRLEHLAKDRWIFLIPDLKLKCDGISLNTAVPWNWVILVGENTKLPLNIIILTI